MFNGRSIIRVGNTVYDKELRYYEPDVTTHQLSYTDNSVTIGGVTYYKEIPAKRVVKSTSRTFICDKDYTLYSLSKKLNTTVTNLKTKNNCLSYAQKGSKVCY